ncbi:MAG: hypothetical protein ACRYFW_11000 [Janthinobacterium lividum]
MAVHEVACEAEAVGQAGVDGGEVLQALHLPRIGLSLLVGDWRETASPATLAHTMLARVKPAIRAQYGAAIVDGKVIDGRGGADGAPFTS